MKIGIAMMLRLFEPINEVMFIPLEINNVSLLNLPKPDQNNYTLYLFIRSSKADLINSLWIVKS